MQSIYAWGSFHFFGPGPENYSAPPEITVGRTYEQRKTREPHRLKVESDTIRNVNSNDPVPECGQVIRLIRYRVVNAAGDPVGRVAHGELFPGPITNPCTGSGPPPTSCSRIVQGQLRPNYTDGGGRFTDSIAIGCPAPSDDCGFVIDPNYWNWCTFSGFETTRIPLAKLRYEARKRVISINNRTTRWPDGTQFFSNGGISLPQ